MKLSVIVPVYNMAADNKLSFCLDSLVNQTLSDMEIIAVDDCSTDESLSILKSYEEKYPEKFRVFQTLENKRQGGAKNVGLSYAKGEWIGFIDSDDWITSDYYERLIKAAEDMGADMAGCDYQLVDSHTFEPGKHVPNNTLEQAGDLDEAKYKSLILDSGSLVVKIYRRENIIDYPNRFPEHIFYEDNAISNSWMLRAHKFAYIPEPMYYYYQHNTSTVHTITTERLNDRREAGRVMIKEAKEFGFYDKYKAEIEYSFTVLFYINTLMSYMFGVKNCKLSYVRELGKEMKEFFPDFQSNPYFLERTDAENKKLIALQQKSSLLFVLYFKALWTYRNFRKRGMK